MKRALAFVLLAASLALAAASSVLAADSSVKDFKKEWDAAAGLAAGARGEAQAKALERLRGATSVEAAQAALGAAIDARAELAGIDAALAVLRGYSSDPIRAWMSKQVTADREPRARVVLCDAIGAWPPEAAAKALAPALRDKESSVVCAAAASLGKVRTKESVTALIAALKDRDGRARADIVEALRGLTGKKLDAAGEWESWWSAEREAFSFDAPPSREEPVHAPSGAPRTTSNGSGLYETISSNRVIFVIDTSYSMRITGEVQVGTGGKKEVSRLKYVKDELVAAIDAQLTKKCLFNVIAFSTVVTPWKTKLVEASDANRKAAKAWVAALEPDDETNVYDALEVALQDKQVDTIYLLTDGFPTKGKITNMDLIRAEVKKLNATRRVRIHTIAFVIGDGTKFNVTENKDMSKNFMRALADEAGGTFRAFDDVK